MYKAVTESTPALPFPLPFPTQKQAVISLVVREISGQTLQWLCISIASHGASRRVGNHTGRARRAHEVCWLGADTGCVPELREWKGWVCSLSALGIARKRMICLSASLSSYVEMVIPSIPTGAKVWWRARRKAAWGVFVGPKGTLVRLRRGFQWFAAFKRIIENIKVEIINSS